MSLITLETKVNLKTNCLLVIGGCITLVAVVIWFGPFLQFE